MSHLISKRLPTPIRFVILLVLVLANPLTAQDDLPIDEGDRFVSVGQLATVDLTGGTKRFVLLDEQGEVLSRLRPAAGVDLVEFVGQEVGVTARTLINGDTPVLLAEQITSFGKARQLTHDNLDKHIALAAHEEVQGGGESVDKGDESLPAPAESIVSAYPMTQHGDVVVDGAVFDGDCGIPGCASCGGGCGNRTCATCAACPCGLPGRFWIRAEALIWWTSGMDTPALVTTSPPGTSRANAGVLGQPGTQTLFGGDDLFSDSRSGARFRIGKWCDSCNWVGFETDFFFLADEDQNYHRNDVGSTIYARPFFNANLGRQDSELVQFPGVLTGAVQVDADTSLWSISPRLRVNLACERFPGCNPCDPCAIGGYRMDLLVGYRYMGLEDELRIRETLATVDEDTPTYFDLRDQFDTSNDFHGADLGLLWEGYQGPWSLELIGRIGIGNTKQEVAINGSTATTADGNTFNDPGGLLALGSNIGTYSRDEFTVIPEFSATLGYALSARTRFLVGYTFIYWNNVVRAGDIIDTRVNTDLLPPAQATTGPNVPAFAFTDSSFWAQGLSLGLEYRW